LSNRFLLKVIYIKAKTKLTYLDLMPTQVKDHQVFLKCRQFN